MRRAGLFVRGGVCVRARWCVPLVVLICLLLVRAQAYQTAGVTSPLGFTVASTDQGAIGLLAGTGDGNAASTAYLSGGRLHLDFSRGYLGGGGFGFAPGDRYRFRGLFHVVNRGAEARYIYVYVPGGGLVGLGAIYGRQATDPEVATMLAGSGGACLGALPLPAAATLLVDVHWEIDPGAVSQDFTVQVSGAASEAAGCPG